MIDNNNIVLISDSDSVAKSVLEKLVLLRKNDNIRTCSYGNIKSALKDSLFSLAILVEDDDENSTLKLINNIKQVNNNTEILLIFIANRY